ncbi:ATP-binding protein [Bacillus sp. WMMC1349]|uniref:ATP-binding protein n=1 Tax=Bacillus sp. WMMC1349 TaxID=2736254 RepID=UPI001553217D|nr:ATP-binding protein [Bacillus sp. WMMC1349]NPC90994.1 ATP-binding protein [Bacillus sp. WMMC1349]NPC91039.1 ATP-binding protein [Bacillus sp. WMMC1349]NPC94978.1 ATP-binding protein [Bacillus sp. WMMC1349]NPC95034.1 ATP-binding protein [Bacillus sp. WMMC1349]NPC95068.1 ATP-binding protein [Bacillus sp. WMMC1349]
MEKILKKLQERSAQSLVEESDALEKKGEYDCPTCKDELGYLENRDGIEVWVRCKCVEWRRIRKLMNSSDITAEFEKLQFKNFVTEGKHGLIVDAYDCAVDYYKNFDSIKDKRKNSIALLGQPGSGKTHLLTAISNKLIKSKNVPVQYFPYVEGFNDLKDDFEKLEEKLRRMKEVDVLFIDDLFKPLKGKPRATDWQVEQTYSVINYRYLNHKPILISSELDIEQLVQIDEALGTRIYEMCENYIVIIKGDRMKLNHRLGAWK